MHIKRMLFFSLFIGLSACGLNQTSRETTGEVRVLLPLSTPEAGSEAGSYSFQVVPLLQISALDQVRGAFARFFLSPSSKDGQLTGDFPSAEFLKNKDGVFVPKNELSQQMASIYYHMQNMHQLDQTIGAGGVNAWPRDIGLRVRLKTSESSEEFEENNALYDGPLDAIVIVPYSSGEIPLSVNAGVLAHEHFHSLFYKLVTKKLLQAKYLNSNKDLTLHSASTESEALTANLVILKGLNEGLADYWGWMYTQDNDFIQHSLSKLSQRRSLSISALENENFRFKSPTDLSNDISTLSIDNEGQSLVGYAYSLGTDFAKSMKILSLRIQQERKIARADSQKIVATALFEGLKILPETIINEKNKAGALSVISMKTLFLQFINSVKDLKPSECEWAKGVLLRSEMLGAEKCKNSEAKVSLK